ncbi:uncharacterized protein CPUR_07385 [Claviceps purpurea 20.1]|uniref:F-box domain-containing protein n=1 Tax=Claviceps purpurea (strain 20.1) TaxID=1111077 RepID=M1WB81_CLAP2|nr:uncharacterized protein CPUR_07385 [Claviceps purpurea 20.1]
MASCSVANAHHSLHYSHPTTSRHFGGLVFPHQSTASSCSRVTRRIFQKLSCELLVLVLEQLRLLDTRSIWTVRSVCRVFDELATPIAYRRVSLNEKIVNSDAQRRFCAAVEHISAYTRHVIIRSNLMPSGTRRLLSGVRKLSTITLDYVQDGDHQTTTGPWSVCDILDFEQLQRHNIKVSIQSLPLGGSQQDLPQSLLDPVLAKRLVCLQLAKPMPPLTTRVDTLKRLLVQCSALETLEYEDLGRGTSFTFSEGECLPAVSKLALKSYDWTHSADEVARHWNMAALRSLSLVSVPVYNFLGSVCPRDLCHLTCLRVHDSQTTSLERQEAATRWLHDLVKNYIATLHILDITCHTRLFPVEAITKHGRSLREVRFRDHLGFQHDDAQCPTLSPRDIAKLGATLPFVHTLELDMDYRLCSPPEFLQALSTFPRLQNLTLHVQTLLRESDAPDEASRDRLRDQDCESAMQTFSFLLRQRDRTNPDVPWRHMTINVGGWRRVMLRRTGSEWRRKNACGLYAERCFVLQRGEGGQYTFREDMCHDAGQYLSTAQL